MVGGQEVAFKPGKRLYATELWAQQHGFNLPQDPAVLGPELKKRGLTVTTGFVMHHFEDPALWPTIESEMHSVGRVLQQLGGPFLLLIGDTYTNLFTGEPTHPSKLDADGWNSQAVVTDVGSVKGPLVDSINHPSFVGGHPMAGSEQVGVEGASGELFVGATWVLTPTTATRPETYTTLHGILRELGANIERVQILYSS